MADRPAITDPALAQSLFGQLAENPPLNEQDFVFMYQQAIQSKDYADKVQTLFKPSNNNVSEGERQAWYTWVNQQAKAALTQRTDTNLATVGGVNVSPEDVLMVGGGVAAAAHGAPTALKLVKGAMQGAAPIVKYETVKYGLQRMGVPVPLAVVAATAVAGMNRHSAEEAPKSVGSAIDEAVARGELRRAPGWTPDQGPLTRPAKAPIPAPPPAEAGPASVAPSTAPAPPAPPAPISAAPTAPITSTPAAVTATRYNPATALADAKQAFQAAGATPQLGELSWVTTYMKAGLSATDAVKKALAYRPTSSMSAAEALAQKFGTPSDAEVASLVRTKNLETSRAKGGPKR